MQAGGYKEIPSRRPNRRHQKEFRSILEDKLFENIAMIWTPAKTMKKSSPNQPRTGGYKETPQKTQKVSGSPK